MTVRSARRRPFTASVEDLRSPCGFTYMEIAKASHDVRSHSWFQDLVTATDPWDVSPPKLPADIEKFATLFGCSSTMVREMIAEEWYEVVPLEMSARVRGAAADIDALGAKEWAALELVLQRMVAAAAESPVPGTAR